MPAATPALAAPPLHVLVMEDHAPLREQIVAVLVADGHRVDEAAHGGVALNTALGQPFDVLVLDRPFARPMLLTVHGVGFRLDSAEPP